MVNTYDINVMVNGQIKPIKLFEGENLAEKINQMFGHVSWYIVGAQATLEQGSQTVNTPYVYATQLSTIPALTALPYSAGEPLNMQNSLPQPNTAASPYPNQDTAMNYPNQNNALTGFISAIETEYGQMGLIALAAVGIGVVYMLSQKKRLL